MGSQPAETISGWMELSCAKQAPVNLALRVAEGEHVVTYAIRLPFDAFEMARTTFT